MKSTGRSRKQSKFQRFYNKAIVPGEKKVSGYVALIPGEGIGPQLAGKTFNTIDQVQTVFQKLKVPITFDVFSDFKNDRSCIEKIKSYSTILRGPFSHKMEDKREESLQI